MSENKSVFNTLFAINVNDKVEKKNGLSYVSWAYAWAEVKKLFPSATYTIYERETEYGAVNYFTDGKTCWVKTGVTIEGLEHIEQLPVMDFRNNSILLEKVTSFDVNKTIQRSLTKAVARHGLGLYIYAGEDLPEEEKNQGGTLATKNQIEMIVKLYKPEELNKMLGNLKKTIDELTVDEASKMIKARKG